MFRIKSLILHCFMRYIGLIIVFRFALAQAPTIPPGNVDLNSRSLQAHAALPLNNFGTSDLLGVLDDAEQNAKEHRIASTGLDFITTDELRPGTPAEIMQTYQKLTCLADGIVIGHTNLWESHLSASRTNIYTDHDFNVETVLKDNAVAPLKSHIVLSRPGGVLSLGTGQLKTLDVNPGTFPHLQSNTEYLIFLKYVPSTGGYEAYGAYATFVANAAQWQILRKALNGLSLPGFTRGTLEKNITRWLPSCTQ